MPKWSESLKMISSQLQCAMALNLLTFTHLLSLCYCNVVEEAITSPLSSGIVISILQRLMPYPLPKVWFLGCLNVLDFSAFVYMVGPGTAALEKA